MRSTPPYRAPASRHLRRSGRISRLALWAITVLVLLFAGLVLYQLLIANRRRFGRDDDLFAELAGAKLVDLHPPADYNPAAWPQWRGAFRAGLTHAPDLLTDWPEGGPERLWEADAGEGYSSFAIARGLAVSLLGRDGQEVVVCWDLETGKERWQHPYTPAAAYDYGGPRATPTIDGERVFTMGSAGLLLCLDLATGKVVWQKDLRREVGAIAPRWGFACSVLVEGDRVYVAPGGTSGRCLAAFHKEDGKLAWVAQDDPAGYSSPVLMTVAGVPQVVFFTGRRLLGVTPDEGKLLWEFPWETQFEVNAATPLPIRAELPRSGRATPDSKPLDYVFISAGYRKGCALVKVIPEGKGRFHARAVYESNELCCHFSSPVRIADHLYALDETRDLTCLELRTGQVKWRQRGFRKGSLIGVDGKLIVLGENGHLALVEADPERYHELARCKPFRNRCWTLPVLADGRLLLRDQQKVLCLKLR
jgi:outer membrane protein assembly factor BamB